MDQNVSAVVLLIGLAVGVDYSLFYIKREREERAAGKGHRAALEAAAATSGRSVLISGVTVMIAMAGMFFTGDKTFMSFGVGTMIVVGVAMLGSLTVLPALLSQLGDRVEKGRIPFLAPAPPRARREPLLVGDPDAGAAAPGRLGGRRRPPCCSRWRCRCSHAHRAVRPRLAAEEHADRRRRSTGSRTRSPAARAGARRDQGRHRLRRRRRRAIAELQDEGARDRRRCTGPIEVDVNAGHTVARVAIPFDGKGTDATSQRAL